MLPVFHDVCSSEMHNLSRLSGVKDGLKREVIEVLCKGFPLEIHIHSERGEGLIKCCTEILIQQGLPGLPWQPSAYQVGAEKVVSVLLVIMGQY